MKKDKLVFATERQEKMFNVLLSFIRTIGPDQYAKHEREILAVIERESLRSEYRKVETFQTPFGKNAEAFRAKAEFWLKTVYLKLEEEKLDVLVGLFKSMQKYNEERPEDFPNQRQPEEFVLSAMAIEPNPRVYVINVVKEKKEKEEREMKDLFKGKLF